MAFNIGMNKNRLEALIDGVFAILITLLALDIKLGKELGHPCCAKCSYELCCDLV